MKVLLLVFTMVLFNCGLLSVLNGDNELVGDFAPLKVGNEWVYSVRTSSYYDNPGLKANKSVDMTLSILGSYHSGDTIFYDASIEERGDSSYSRPYYTGTFIRDTTDIKIIDTTWRLTFYELMTMPDSSFRRFPLFLKSYDRGYPFCSTPLFLTNTAKKDETTYFKGGYNYAPPVESYFPILDCHVASAGSIRTSLVFRADIGMVSFAFFIPGSHMYHSVGYTLTSFNGIPFDTSLINYPTE